MLHAILVTAYKDFDALLALSKAFDSRFRLYIHIDRKSRIHRVRPDILETLRDLPTVRLVRSRFSVNWGGIRHLYAVLDLARAAFKDRQDAQFFHWITGQDYPVRSGDEFESFFSKNSHSSFLKWFSLPAEIWQLESGGLDRINFYHLYDLLKIGKGNRLNQAFLHLQRTWGLHRPYSEHLPSPHGGPGYWSINREAMNYVLAQSRANPALLKRLRHCFCAEELYVHTLLLNSTLAGSVINDDLRYVDWSSNRGGVHPAILDDSDFDSIHQSTAFFARKLDSKHSLGLRRMIDTAIGNHQGSA